MAVQMHGLEMAKEAEGRGSGKGIIFEFSYNKNPAQCFEMLCELNSNVTNKGKALSFISFFVIKSFLFLNSQVFSVNVYHCYDSSDFCQCNYLPNRVDAFISASGSRQKSIEKCLTLLINELQEVLCFDEHRQILHIPSKKYDFLTVTAISKRVSVFALPLSLITALSANYF